MTNCETLIVLYFCVTFFCSIKGFNVDTAKLKNVSPNQLLDIEEVNGNTEELRATAEKYLDDNNVDIMKLYKLRGPIEIVFQDQDYIDVLEVQPIEDGK